MSTAVAFWASLLWIELTQPLWLSGLESRVRAQVLLFIAVAGVFMRAAEGLVSSWQ